MVASVTRLPAACGRGALLSRLVGRGRIDQAVRVEHDATGAQRLLDGRVLTPRRRA
jgi:hypothetical protein